jgi:hypothetical protein
MSAKVARNITELRGEHVLTGLFSQAFLEHFNHSSVPRGLRGGGLRVSAPLVQWRFISAAGGVQLLAKAIFETNASDIPLKDCWNDLGVIGKLLELVDPPI